MNTAPYAPHDTLDILAHAEGGAAPLAWALEQISLRPRLLNASKRAVLLAVAALTARELCAPNGYNGLYASDVAHLLEWKTDRARTNLISLVTMGLLVIEDPSASAFVYRLPESAFNRHPARL